MPKPMSVFSLACAFAWACSPSPSSAPKPRAPTPPSSTPPELPGEPMPDAMPELSVEGGEEANGGPDDASIAASPVTGACIAKRVEAPAKATFGAKAIGFATWLSESGRFAVLYQFKTDDDHDGKIAPSFGHHGEPMGDRPTISVFDLATSSETPVDAVLAFDTKARYLLAREKRHLYLFDTATGRREDLAQKGAVVEEDQNCSFGPRAAGFDLTGGRLHYLRSKPARAVVRELETGAEAEYPVKKGDLWRADAEHLPGWASLAEIEDTNGDGKIVFPVRQTTCPCPPWGRFAMSCSTGGLVGDDKFTWWLVSNRGARLEMADGALVPAGAKSAIDPKSGKIIDADGKAIAPPVSCSGATPFVGAPGALLACEGGSRLFFPDDRKEITLGAEVELTTRVVRSADKRPWAGVKIAAPGGATVLGRLRLDDGRLERGVPLGALGRHMAPTGWVQGTLRRGTLVENVATGKRVEVDVPAKVDLLSAVVGHLPDDSFIAVAPERCAYVASKEMPQFATTAGCYLTPAKTHGGGLHEGPWTLRCAK